MKGSKTSKDVGSISNLEGHDTSEGTFLEKKGALSKNKKGISLFIAKSWGHLPPVPPVLTSMLQKHLFKGNRIRQKTKQTI